MKQKIKKPVSYGRQGTTLIELLIVIAVIGILSSIVIVTLGGAKQDARDVNYQAYVSQMTKLVEAGSIKGLWKGEGIPSSGWYCLGDYGATCFWTTTYKNDTAVDNVVKKLTGGSLPKGVDLPHRSKLGFAPNPGGVLIGFTATTVRIFVYVYSNDPEYLKFCPLNYTVMSASSGYTYGYCYKDFPR